MSDTPSGNDPIGPQRRVIPNEAEPDMRDKPQKRRNRRQRIAILSVLSLLIFIGGAAAAGFAVIHQLTSNIQRVPVAGLAALEGPAGGPSGGGETVLLTSSHFGPTGSSVPVHSPPGYSSMIILLHLNADHRACCEVSIPPQTMVNVPGVGREQLWYAARIGGPSLLVKTVEHLTHIPINHYARISLLHVQDLINAIGGVDVRIQATTTSYGHTFHSGVNHLSGLTAIYYVRQPTLSPSGKMLRAQTVLRAMMRKISKHHLLTNPATAFRVTDAFTRALTVDSSFTRSELLALARELRGLSSSAATYLVAPTRMIGGREYFKPRESRELWAAVRQDAAAEFARKYPSAVLPEVVP